MCYSQAWELALEKASQSLHYFCADLSLWMSICNAFLSMSPILGLPEDVLREIFVRCLPESHNATLSSTDAPLVLTHVCHVWRDIALATTRLWSSLHIPLGSSPDLDYAVDEWLSRTGTSVPLSISFGSIERRSTPTLTRLEKWFKRIWDLKLGDRLNSFSFTLCGKDEDIQAFIERCRQADFFPTQSVNKLAVQLDILNPFQVGESAAFSALELHRSSNLRSLDISVAHHLYILPKCFTHQTFCMNLKVLDLQGRSFESVQPYVVRCAALYQILSQCINLVRLRTYTGGTMSGPTTTTLPETALNSQLQHVSLFLYDLAGVWTAELLDRCDWPALTSLHLGSNGVRESRDGEPIVDALTTKFGSKLTSLRFTYTCLADARLLRLLSGLRFLVQLHVEDGKIPMLNVGIGGNEGGSDGLPVGYEDGVIHALTPGLRREVEGDQCYCPLLQYFRWDGRTRFSDAAIVQLLHKRAQSPVTLKQVVINFDRAEQMDVGAACTRLIEDGFKLRLTYRVPLRATNQLSSVYRGLFVEEDPLAMGWN